MGRRLDLQNELEVLMTSSYPGQFPDSTSPSKYHVYFQPNDNTRMDYPAIVYSRDGLDDKRANNEAYSQTTRYRITVIDRNPDSPIPELLSRFPMTRFTAHQVKDGLNQDIYTTYF